MSKRAAFTQDAPDKRARLSHEPDSLPAEEVAADFKDSLSDLSMNDRYQISTLTIIAKENTEHALAISDVLLNHIKTVAPPRKLPALYVLDSIVKNVGTPYTLFLSRNLYRTFMDAYTLVDNGVRKQMESMLKTWKEPIPGSMDPKPVFSVELTRTIKNALIRARTVLVEQNKAMPGMMMGRPSHAMSPHVVPPQPVPTPPYPSYHYQQPSQPQNQQQFAPEYQYNVPGYQTPSFPPAPVRSPPPNPYAYQQPSPYPPQLVPPPSTPNSFSLVALLQASGQFPPPPTPQQHQIPPPPQQQQENFHFPGLEALIQAQPQLHTATHPTSSAYPPPPIPPIPQIPNLSFSLPKTLTPPVQHVQPVKQSYFKSTSFDDLDFSSASLKQPRPHLAKLLFASFSASSQCTTCGRRFAIDTQDGRARKARHLDAHFRTNMRLTAAAEGRGPPGGVTRSWFLDEMEWIRYREVDDAEPVDEHANAGSGAAGSAGGNGNVNSSVGGGKGGASNEKYIIAPSLSSTEKRACPICQEEFAAVWHDVEQEWVWMDAVKIPSNGSLSDPATAVYHASCLESMARDGVARKL